MVDRHLGRLARKDIQGRWRLGLLGVDEHQSLKGTLGDPGEQVDDEVALRVDVHHATAGCHVGECQVGEQRRLARAGRADDVGVEAAVFDSKGDGTPGADLGVPEDPEPGSVTD
ncbi:MAG TPA: hypothetical protein VMU76_04685, partial [Acidimicrobiales bacterium]|nr:hypothetical protein [Acidimicrobiales bacterium]